MLAGIQQQQQQGIFHTSSQRSKIPFWTSPIHVFDVKILGSLSMLAEAELWLLV